MFLTFGHQPPQSFFLDSLLLLLLLPLSVRVPGQHGLVDLLHLGNVGLVPALHLPAVVEDGVDVLAVLGSPLPLALHALLLFKALCCPVKRKFLLQN